jgi:succinate dehydrogenase/fumarate reductase flavoprotein subunit
MKHDFGLREAIAAILTACVILVGGTSSVHAQSFSAGRADGEDGKRNSASDAEARRQAAAQERADAARQAAEERAAQVARQMQAIQDNNARNQALIQDAGDRILDVLRKPDHAQSDDDDQ